MKCEWRTKVFWILTAAVVVGSAVLVCDGWDLLGLSVRCTTAERARGVAQAPYLAASQPLPVSPNASWEALFFHAHSR